MVRIKLLDFRIELIETWFVIGKCEGFEDDFTIVIHNKTVVFVFGNIDTNKIGHDDTFYNALLEKLHNVFDPSRLAVYKTSGVNQLINF